MVAASSETGAGLEGEWPLDGSRFAGQLPPVVRAATFAIRKKAVSIYTLDQYVESRIMTPAQCAAIKKAIRDHRNILVIGGTGTGKTTLVNAVINEMVVVDLPTVTGDPLPPPPVVMRSEEMASLLPVAARLGVSLVKLHAVPENPASA